MTIIRKCKNKIDRRLWFSIAAVAVMALFLLGPLNHYVFQSLYTSNYYHLGIPALIALYLAFRGLRDGKEMAILAMYLLWAVITRVLNGDRFLLAEGDYLIDLGTMILLFAPGLLLDSEKRRKLFMSVAVFVVAFYFIAGLICLFSAFTRTYIENPIDFRGIGYPDFLNGTGGDFDSGRLHFLSFQFNETAGQFVIAFGLCLMLLFKTRHTVLRVILGLAAFIDYVVIGLTLSRNGQTCACLALGIMAGILALERIRRGTLFPRFTVFLLCFILTTVLTYQGFEPVRYGIWQVYQSTWGSERQEEKTAEVMDPSLQQTRNSLLAAGTEDNEEYRADSREYFESGRKEIFMSAFKSLQLEPRRLLLGSSYDHVMDYSHQLIREQAKHFHNTFLQVVNEFGLPGLFLVILFYYYMLKSSFFLIMDSRESCSVFSKMFTIIPLVFLFYYLLEVGIFKIVDRADFRNTFFYFSCGMLTAVAREKSDAC